jgi:hypothetical protein
MEENKKNESEVILNKLVSLQSEVILIDKNFIHREEFSEREPSEERISRHIKYLSS